MSTIDLHSHSKYSSDGELDPRDLVRLAHEQGVQTLAITDHNSVRGVAEGVAAAAEIPGLQYIPGIEIDVSWEGLNLHILGLGVDYTAPVFAEVEENALLGETQFCVQVGEGFQKLGLHADLDGLLAESPYLSPERLIRTIYADPFNQKHELMAPYLKEGARGDMPLFNIYYDYCLPGKPLFFTRNCMALDAVLSLIQANGGVSFLAHPGGSLDDFKPQLAALCERGVEGVEAFSTYHSAEQNLFFAEQGKALGMLISSGSDFHGAVKPAIQLGQLDEGEYASDVARSVDVILERMQQS